MFKLCLFLYVSLILQVSRACDDGNDEHLAAARQQESVDYLTNAYGLAPNPWGSPYYYQPSRVPGLIPIWVGLMVYRATVIYIFIYRICQRVRGTDTSQQATSQHHAVLELL